MEEEEDFKPIDLLKSLKVVNENYNKVAIEDGLSLQDINCQDFLSLLQSSWSSVNAPAFGVGLYRLLLEMRVQNKNLIHGALEIYVNRSAVHSSFPPCFLLAQSGNGVEVELLIPLNVEDNIDLDRCGRFLFALDF